MKVFEICDTTDDEMYFPLGIFATIDEAKAEIDKFDLAKEKVSERAEEHETLTIYRRDMGWTEHGFPAMTIDREECYDEEADEYYWRRVVS